MRLPVQEETCREASAGASWPRQSAAAVLLCLAPLLVGGGTAFAATQTAYSPSSGGEVFKTAAGAAYVVLVCIFFYRLLRKRATTGTTQACSSLPYLGSTAAMTYFSALVLCLQSERAATRPALCVQNYRSRFDNKVEQADNATVEKEVQATPLGALW